MNRSVAFALGTLVVTAGAVSAENSFVLDRTRSTAQSLAITNIQADAPGMIEVYAYDDGHPVRFLGAIPIPAGNTAALEMPLHQGITNRRSLNQPTTDELLLVMMNHQWSVAKLVTDAPLTD